MTTTLNASTAGAGGFIATGDNSGSLALQTAGTTAVTIDTSQNVGIGTTSPSNRLSVVTASGSDGFISVSSPTTDTAGVSINGGTSSNKGAIVRFQKNASTKWTMGTDSAIIGSTSDNFHLYGGGADAMLFSTNATERMRILSTGQVLVGKTAAGDFTAGVEFQPSGVVLSYRTGNVSAIFGRSNDGETVRFYNVSSTVGSISTTSSSTAYNTSSDYRLKENIAPMTGALAKVAQLKPVTYKWKVDGSDGEGFIAHELAEVKPDCVSGEKDAVDAEGNPVYQGIDTSFLVATLTAAIQELSAKNDALTARVVALESK